MPATLDRKFEKFLGGPTQPPELRVRVSLDKRNVILMNRKCYQMLGKPTAVYLHFSRADDIIAIEPVHSYRLPAAFPVRVYDTTFSINAAPFCRHFGIKLDATQQFISPEIRDGALQLKLRETITITRKRRMKKASGCA
jgi:hypothetical protein